MSEIILPASCYEEALPDLRAPYLASQIRPLIIQAPKQPDWPCRIALYTIGETLMDRFNLCCAGNWAPVFTVEAQKELQKKDDHNNPITVHYFKVTCSVTVFGSEHSDFGEGEASSAALAEFDARAQAFKRAARWHGPGQCLYVFGGEELKLWRGSETGKLHIPKSGNEPHRKPYFDNATRQKVRDEYDKWLKDEGEGQFGPALNHMQVVEAIRERAVHRHLIAVPDLPGAVTEQTTQAASTDDCERPEPQGRQVGAAAPVPRAEIGAPTESAPPARAASAPPAVPVRRDVHRLPMPDVPASQEAVALAESAGFAGTVAHALSNLARTDGQEGSLSERQNKTVLNWLIVLSELHLTSDEIVHAVQHVAANGTVQERRQATFSKWLAGKASGQAEAPTEHAGAAPEGSVEVQDGTRAQPQAASKADEALETARALNRIHKAMQEHGYPDGTVGLLAKLSIALPPKRGLDWAKVPPSTMTVLADLLESAGQIGWSADLLRKEVHAAHSGKGQPTAAGRFSAFAGHLADLAEANRVSEAA